MAGITHKTKQQQKLLRIVGNFRDGKQKKQQRSSLLTKQELIPFFHEEHVHKYLSSG